MNKSELVKLSKSQLIELMLLKKEKLSKSQLIELLLLKKEKKKPVIIRRILPPLEFRDDYKPVPAQRTKESCLLDEPIPENEIPRGQKILKPSMVKKIKKAVKWGKRKVENWGEWLKKVDVPQIVVDDEIESFQETYL